MNHWAAAFVWSCLTVVCLRAGEVAAAEPGAVDPDASAPRDEQQVVACLNAAEAVDGAVPVQAMRTLSDACGPLLAADVRSVWAGLSGSTSPWLESQLAAALAESTCRRLAKPVKGCRGKYRADFEFMRPSARREAALAVAQAAFVTELGAEQATRLTGPFSSAWQRLFGPVSPQRIVLLPSELGSGSLLFADERDRVDEVARARAAEAFSAHGQVLTADEQQALRALVAEHRLTAEGPRCAVAPSLEHVTLARYGPALAARLTTRCTESTCSVDLSLREPTTSWSDFEHSRGRQTLVATVPVGATVEDWVGAIGGLRPPAPAPPASEALSQGVGLASLGGADDVLGVSLGVSKSGPPVVVVVLAASSGWAVRPAPDDFSAGELAALERDASSASALGRLTRVLLEVGANGRVGRCEAPESAARLCRVLERHRFPVGAARRRVELSLSFRFGEGASLGSISLAPRVQRVAVTSLPHSPDDTRAMDDLVPALTTCLGKEGRARDGLALTLTVDGQGGVTGVRATPVALAVPPLAAGDAFPRGEVECFDKVARRAKLSCPLRADGVVRAVYEVHRRVK
ncbi:MAG: hypothetical protein MUC96_11480 [Myxococcaceae bacterium]|jgi:hypothetical protein|nr:hypothetical protein [Myxococcaceae bacterium]